MDLPEKFFEKLELFILMDSVFTHCIKSRNLTQFPGVQILWKLGEITGFYPVI